MSLTCCRAFDMDQRSRNSLRSGHLARPEFQKALEFIPIVLDRGEQDILEHEQFRSWSSRKFERNDLNTSLVGESLEHRWGCCEKAEDRLLGVSNHKDSIEVGDQPVDHKFLHRVCVLEFIHEEVARTLPDS